MTLHGPSDSSGRLIQGTQWHVDAGFAGTGNGSPEAPFALIQDAIDAAAAGDNILIRSGAYTEDLTLADAIHLQAIGDELVTVTGTATATDVGCTIEGISFIDDGAGSALDITGTAAEEINLRDCLFTSTATGDQAVTCTNTAQTIIADRCDFVADAANANEAVLIAQGTVTFERCVLLHNTSTSNAVLFSGAAAATGILHNCTITGSVELAAAAVAPTVTITGGTLTVGAVSAVIIAATCTANVSECKITSADAGNAAFDGAGDLVRAQNSFAGTATAAAATLTVTDEVSTVQTLSAPNIWYADAAYAGGESFGSELLPYATIQDAIDAANAGDIVRVLPGAYAEDLTLADGVDVVGTSGPLANDVVITGTCTGTDGSYNLSNLSLIDDGAGGALHLTGTGVEAVTLSGCIVACTATGDYAMELDNTNLTLTAMGCRFTTAGANANPTVIVESGVADFTSCDFTHATNTNQALEAQGDAATTITARSCRFTGSVDSQAAAVAPALSLAQCEITVGAAAALNIAATCTQVVNGLVVTSTEAAQDAVLGAGAITVVSPIVYLGTANEIGGTVTPAYSVNSFCQSGSYVEAAGAGTRAITFPEVARSAPSHISVTYEDTGGGAQASSNETDTWAATGFNLTTQVNGTYHWIAFWTA
jgi:hypothetical protein